MSDSEQQTGPNQSTQPSGGAVISDNKQPLQSKKRKWLWLLAIVIVVLAGLAVYHYWPSKSTKPPVKTISAVDKAKQDLAAKGVVWSSLNATQQAGYLADKNLYSAAEQVWQQQLATAKSQQDKLNIYFQQSALALKFKRYNDAQNYANEAKQLAPNSNTPYVALAQLAAAEGNNTAAKQYWQQAITNIDPNNPGANLIEIDYQRSLDALK